MKLKPDKIKLTKYIIYTGFILLWAIPEFKKEWFVSESGKFNNLDFLHILFFIAGIKLGWIYMKEIIFILLSIAFTIQIFVLLNSLFDIKTLTQYPGWIVFPVIELILCVFLLRLKRLEKRISAGTA